MKVYPFILIFVMLAGDLLAQPEVKRDFGDPFIFYRKEMTIGGLIHSNGFGANFRYGKHITGFKKRIYEAEFVNMRHPKEIKVVSPFSESAKSYVYGKQNALFILRTSIGRRKILASKANRGGVEINYFTFIGAAIGITKPVYLEIKYEKTSSGFQSFYVATEKYDPFKHFNDNIYGGAPFSRGLAEIGLHPGVFSKIGLNFDWDNYDNGIKALEIGLSLDSYIQDIPIMAFTDNKQLFLNFYVKMLYGKKW